MKTSTAGISDDQDSFKRIQNCSLLMRQDMLNCAEPSLHGGAALSSKVKEQTIEGKAEVTGIATCGS